MSKKESFVQLFDSLRENQHQRIIIIIEWYKAS